MDSNGHFRSQCIYRRVIIQSEFTIKTEMETKKTPAVRAFVVALIKDFEVRLQSLNAQVQSLAGQLRELKRRNASLPRSSDIPTFHNKKIGR